MAFPLFAAAQTFDHNLYYGITGNTDVQALQEFLTDQGYYGGPISGNYFTLTAKAVKKWQAANDLSPSGYFGMLSRGVANQVFAQQSSAPSLHEVGTTTTLTQTTTSCPTVTTPSGAQINSCNGNIIYLPPQANAQNGNQQPQAVGSKNSTCATCALQNQISQLQQNNQQLQGQVKQLQQQVQVIVNPPPKVPVCKISASPYDNGQTFWTKIYDNGESKLYVPGVSVVFDPKATAYLSAGAGAYVPPACVTNPDLLCPAGTTYPSPLPVSLMNVAVSSDMIPIPMATTTITLTEYISDPTYQATTTCSTVIYPYQQSN